MTFAPPAPACPPGVLVACSRCGALVEVYDLNGAVSDPARFVGGCCLVPVGAKA